MESNEKFIRLRVNANGEINNAEGELVKVTLKELTPNGFQAMEAGGKVQVVALNEDGTETISLPYGAKGVWVRKQDRELFNAGGYEANWLAYLGYCGDPNQEMPADVKPYFLLTSDSDYQATFAHKW